MVYVSIIGCGNMGSALAEGLSKAGGYSVTACDLDPDARERVADYCEETTDDPAAATAGADIVVVAVKPDIVGPVLDSIDLSPEQTLVSFAAGVRREYVQARTDATVVRVMPNIAAAYGDMAAAAVAEDLSDEVRAMLGAVGSFVEVDESLMDIATAVNGSGPAFVFYLLEAMKDAGIESGLNPEQAEVLAAQTFKGAGEIVLQDDRSVDELIDAVCSPNGTTIEGMKVLRASDADTAVMDAVEAARKRSVELAEEFRDD
ncbi:pyrroline-5-carboxylate reductase [Haloarchaeobius sp. HME9146]|uniref:pyrroline-5-carboxylate reductase n=1 Tax=Haloarchaeobius sp. HME9146 TaxID=2978732 RepID=UPI0021BFCA54|nr:pyrroline-5-carboxylate reductase [Haloarchaeobius sp. HME9146]MCT9098265.1 pyrroline-5-carboxylate reductase [Haloarchaeobius sp. HME9146]